jgi:DNA-directed RNA polymerase subunit RPC12/RpoP
MPVQAELRCQMCGHQFEHRIADPDDRRERDVSGPPLPCPRCRSPRLQIVRILRRLFRAG